jgi:hypothetical protein
MHRFSVLGLVVLAALAVPCATWAYVPPAGFIVKTLVSKRELGKAVRIRSALTVFDAETAEQSHFKLSHVYFSATGTLRSTLSDENGLPLYHSELQSRGSSVALNVPAEAIAVLLLEPQWTQVVKALRKQGVRIPSLAIPENSAQPVEGDVESGVMPESTLLKAPIQPSAFLARWNKAIAWVVGDRKNGPQFWVEKDTFLPLRWANKTEIEFQNYKLFKDLPYPRIITLSENKKQLFKEELIELKDLSSVEKERKEAALGFTETGKDLPASLRALVQRYFELL